MVFICRLKSQVSLSKLKQFFRHQKKNGDNITYCGKVVKFQRLPNFTHTTADVMRKSSRYFSSDNK